MRSDRSRKKSLNENQKSIFREFSGQGLTEEHFDGRDWFNNFYHERAFAFLVNKMKYSFEEAFAVLDNLDKDQAYGILQGLSRDEVTALTRYQIDAFVKYGLPKNDLFGLNKHQIQVLFALRKDGIPLDLRNQHWLCSYHHAVALVYLIRVKEKSFFDACEYLKDLDSKQAMAIYFGIEKNELPLLKDHQLSAYIESKKYDGLRKYEDFAGLDQSQIDMVKNLYHFGLTSCLVKEIKQTGDEFGNSLKRLVYEAGIPINEAITGLNLIEIDGLINGFTKDELSDLNEYQAHALIDCKTIKNELCAAHLVGKDWFNSKKHVEALTKMLSWGEFTVEEALQELSDLTGDQAKEVSCGKKRDDIIGLNEFQLKALDNFDLKYRGELTGSHLRGKDWFNTSLHVSVLEHLVVKTKIKIEDAIDQLNGLNEVQLKLFITENINRDSILNLTPIQLAILAKKYDYGFFGFTHDLIDATWLKTQEHADLLKLIYESCHNSSTALTMVKYFNDNGQVKETLEQMQKGEIPYKDYKDMHGPQNQSSYYTSGNTLYSSSTSRSPSTPTQTYSEGGCKLM